MKTMLTKKQIFILLLFASATLSNGQSFPTSDEEPIWNLPFNSLLGAGEHQVYIGNEVVTEGVLWWEIRYSDDFENDDYPDQENLHAGYYRVEGDQVFYKHQLIEEKEGLLYDFSLQEGDSVLCVAPNSLPFPEFFIQYHVLEVDTFTCNDKELKKMQVMFDYDVPNQTRILYYTYWIEGFGDLLYPFPAAICIEAPDCEQFFTCNMLTTVHGQTDSKADPPCISITSLMEENLSSNKEPALRTNLLQQGEERLQILNIEDGRFYQCYIINTKGQILHQIQKQSLATEMNLELPNLRSGFYWLRIEAQNKSMKALPFLIR